MNRSSAIALVLGLVLVAPGTADLLTQEARGATPTAWTATQLVAQAPGTGAGVAPPFVRGSGYYMSWIKILACWLVFVLWIYHLDWVSTDCQELKLEYLRWNPILFGSFLGALVLVWILPWFWLGFPLLVIAYVAPLAAYIVYRNGKVSNEKRVLTPEHIRFWLAHRLAAIGIHMEAEKKAAWEKGPPVVLSARGGTDRDNNARLIASRQSPGFHDARRLVATCLAHRGTAIMLDYTQQAVGVRSLIDGVWHNDDPMEREAGDPMLVSFKTLCGLNPQDRQNQQKGPFRIEHQAIKYEAMLTSQGVKNGERVLIQLEDSKIRLTEYDELGMRQKMQEEIQELLSRRQGFFLISAPPAHGLRTTSHVLLRKTDRFTREFLAVEEESRRYETVENIPVSTYSAANGQTPLNILPRMFRAMPDVVVVRDLVDAETVELLCEEIDEGRLIIGTIRARDSVEALLRVLALKVAPATFAKRVLAVLNQRLVRKLCDECKEAYAPTPQVLQQLGIPAGRVQAFYRPPQEPEELCDACNGVGFKGRTAVFELLVLDDATRQALAAGANAEELRKLAQKGGMRSVQAEGILLVAKGVTSLAELMRAIKQ